MSIQTDSEEKYDTYSALLNYRDDLRFLERKRDSINPEELPEDDESYEQLLNEIAECERKIEEFEQELGLD